MQQPGERRRFMPLYSLMVATEPLPAAVWDEIGWDGRETVSDLRHLFFYAQRTPDDRIAIGGRGAPYRLGSPLDEAYERNDGVRARLVRTLAERFPAVASAAITHHWGGPLGVPRDWCCSVHYDRATGFGWAGGYTGHGVVTSNVLGRTLADLVLRARQRSRLAAVGRPREPALGARAAALPGLARDRGHARQRRSRRGRARPPGPAHAARAAVHAGPLMANDPRILRPRTLPSH